VENEGMQDTIDARDSYHGDEIAIIGMAGRFPGAETTDAFWQNIRDGVEAITFFSDQALLDAGVPADYLADPNYVKAAGVLEQVDGFDAAFFGFNPREAELTDPQQRLFLECAWEAIESAGYNTETYTGWIGVYGGVSANTYLLFNLATHRDLVEKTGGLQLGIGNDKDFLASRVSYKLNLQGPSITVQTACSTSLVAVHLASQSLLAGECDMALAGGVSVKVPHIAGYFYQPGGIHSPDGHCRAFDEHSLGSVSGSGAAVVVLKRLADALADGDNIQAVIKGTAVNNDGRFKAGFTAPSVHGQVSVINEALTLAKVAPESISYIETHGSGTPLGDLIEATALNQVFGDKAPPHSCAIGSVKTNVGHLDAAAGAAGLIKTVLALRHRELPPSLHFHSPNAKIDFANSPLYVNTQRSAWDTGAVRRAGVSSFGLGGTNAHVIVEEAPPIAASGPARSWQMLTLSAKTDTALDAMIDRLAAYLQQQPDAQLADVAYTCHVGRTVFEHRCMLLCQTREQALEALQARDPRRLQFSDQEMRARPIAFLFPGLGEQYVGMARELYQTEAVFQEQVDRCCELLTARLHLDLRDVLYAEQHDDASDDGQSGELDLRAMLAAPRAVAPDNMQSLDQTYLTQPALFVIEYALAQLWLSWGIQPQALLGYSLGEYVAACLSGVFSLEDALAVVAERARLIQALPAGGMVAVPLAAAALTPLLNADLDISGINGPELCVVSGTLAAIAALEEELRARQIATRRLRTTHAFHSQMMAAIVEDVVALFRTIRLAPPTIPYISNLTGTWITDAEATDPQYWARHVCEPVRFADGVRALWQQSNPILLEVGPGQTLSSLATQSVEHSARDDRVALPSLRPLYDRRSDQQFVLNTLGKLWLAGCAPDWTAFYAGEQRRRVALPTYPFERRRYWIDPGSRALGAAPASAATNGASEPAAAESAVAIPLHPRPSGRNPYVAPRNEIEHMLAVVWQELLGIEQISIYDNFFDLGGHSLIATQVVARLRESFPIEVQLEKLFETPTIESLAGMLEDLLLEKLESLSEEEAERLVASFLEPVHSRPLDEVDGV
jgi:acyl transferase domain-containing protein